DCAVRKRLVTGKEVAQCPTVHVIRRTSASVVPRAQNFETREWIVLSDQHTRMCDHLCANKRRAHAKTASHDEYSCQSQHLIMPIASLQLWHRERRPDTSATPSPS